jgi:7-cyano-7-deazaguanine reductase
MTTVLDNSRISKHLGKVSEYKDQYDPTLLVREPRCNNRKHLDISDDNLPFVGYDTWNAYEVSALTETGLPVTGVAKIVYPCDSKYIVESKSIKLYFNSFNMFKCGPSPDHAFSYIEDTAEKDLSKLLDTNVKVSIINDVTTGPVKLFNYNMYRTLEDHCDSNFETDVYIETPELLEIDPHSFDQVDGSTKQFFHSGLLKSNCRVTSQPDWGDVFIYIKGQNIIDPASLLRYIISFRDECHFHEEICETIYKRLHDVYLPSELCVTCLYARRGGIDINPVRASSADLINDDLIDENVLHAKTLKQ